MTISYKGKWIVLLSDTHGRHRKLPNYEADFIIHTGDACTDGNMNELDDFFDWFDACHATHKIFVAGNHELSFEFSPEEFLQRIPRTITFMDDTAQSIDGLTFVALAARPWLLTYPECILPNKRIDFLLTHGAPKNILDNGIGCNILPAFIKKHTPVYHVFGHIHEFGQEIKHISGTTFVNASTYSYV